MYLLYLSNLWLTKRACHIPGLKELQYFTELLAGGAPGSKDTSPDLETNNNKCDGTPPMPNRPLGGIPPPGPAVRRAFSLNRSPGVP